MTNVFFGFGHGFGGTHLLANLLNILPNVDCKHERKGPNSKYAMFDKYMDVFHGDVSAGDVAVKLERLDMVSSIIRGGKVFGEVNGILGFFVTPLFKMWPDAKFIYMMRDPRGQVRTAYNTGIFDDGVSKTILSAHPDWDSVWWWPFPASTDPTFNRWNVLSNYEKCAWFWAAYNDFVIFQLEKLPGKQVFYYKFEDMIKGNRIDELYKFLGLNKPMDSQIQKIVAIKHGKTPTRVVNPIPTWDAQNKIQQKSVLEFVEQTMKKLGYEVKQ
jgi:hypothetical protein